MFNVYQCLFALLGLSHSTFNPLLSPRCLLLYSLSVSPGRDNPLNPKHYSLPFDDELHRAVVATHDIAQDRGIVDALGKAL